MTQKGKKVDCIVHEEWHTKVLAESTVHEEWHNKALIDRKC